MKINISSRILLACLNKSKPSGCSRLVDGGLPGVAIEIAWGVGALAGGIASDPGLAGGPRVPMRLTADGASGISCCNLLPLNSLSGKGGSAEGLGIGGADGRSIVKPSELTDGDTTTERDLGVDGTLLDGRDAEGALLEAGVFKSTRGDLLDAGVSGSANDEGGPGRNIDAGVDGTLLDAGVFKSTSGDLLSAGVPGRR